MINPEGFSPSPDMGIGGETIDIHGMHFSPHDSEWITIRDTVDPLVSAMMMEESVVSEGIRFSVSNGVETVEITFIDNDDVEGYDLWKINSRHDRIHKDVFTGTFSEDLTVGESFDELYTAWENGEMEPRTDYIEGHLILADRFWDRVLEETGLEEIDSYQDIRPFADISYY